MTIAAHLVFTDNSSRNYLQQSINLLAGKHSDDHFIIFISDGIIAKEFTAANITPVVIKPAIKNNLSLYYWYNFKLPALLKRYNATAFISEQNVLSLRTLVPQYLFINNTPWLLPGVDRYKKFTQKYFHRFAEKAAAIFTTEKYITAAIEKNYPAAVRKVFTGYHGILTIFAPFSWEQKEQTTIVHTDEKDYFLYYVSVNTTPFIKAALKAFSVFKKWQKSSMQLVLMADGNIPDNLVPDMATYKYRAEVKILSPASVEITATLVAAAHAVLYFPQNFTGENIGLNAMQCDVPLITRLTEEAEISYADAAIYSEGNETAIAEKMIMIYKDESLRKTIVANGRTLIAQYDLQRSADELWAVIQVNTTTTLPR